MSDGYMNGMRFNIATCTTRSGVFYYVICYENGMQETVSEAKLRYYDPQSISKFNKRINKKWQTGDSVSIFPLSFNWKDLVTPTTRVYCLYLFLGDIFQFYIKISIKNNLFLKWI